MAASETPIITNQVEYNPFEDRSALLEFCIEHDVLLTAYSPLAKGRVARDDTLAEIGERYGKTGAQVALRWLVHQPNVVAIPRPPARTTSGRTSTSSTLHSPTTRWRPWRNSAAARSIGSVRCSTSECVLRRSVSPRWSRVGCL